MNLYSPLKTAPRLGWTLGRVTDLARHALDALMSEPARTTQPTQAWIAGAVTPIDDHPLEEVLSAFDRLFDTTEPLAARHQGRWSLGPWSAGDAPDTDRAAATLRADGARVLRLRLDGRDVALAGVHPLPAAAPCVS